MSIRTVEGTLLAAFALLSGCARTAPPAPPVEVATNSVEPTVVEVAVTTTVVAPAEKLVASGTNTAGDSGGRLLYVYHDDQDPGNHFTETHVEGDRQAIEYEPRADYLPVSGTTCMRWIYNLMDKRLGWAEVTWRQPDSAPMNLSGARFLKFAARGETGNEMLTVGMRGQGGRIGAAYRRELVDLKLEKGWKEYAVPLDRLNLSMVVDGFFWKVTAAKNAGGEVVFYLDDIRYEY